MHFNILAVALCALSATDSVYAHPSSRGLGRRGADLHRRAAYPSRIGRRSQIASLQQLACTLPPAAGQEEAAAGEGEGEGNEVEIESAFDVATPVVGGEVKQDLVFTPSTVGKFEYEFQAAAADEITVTEKVGGAVAPAGFEAIEPNSYVVALGVSKGAGLTLSKIDYIFDPASAGLVGKDITTAQVGRLCPETGSFVISETLGELEFEAEEAEVTLNLNKNVTAEGEWGIFLPVAAAAAAPAAPAAGEGKGKGKATRERTETARDGNDSDDED